MNNLQLIENTDQLIPIRLQDQTEITKKLAAIVSHCFNLAGQTYDVLTLETIVKAVSKQIYLDYKSLSYILHLNRARWENTKNIMG
jgi:hypothetical protein